MKLEAPEAVGQARLVSLAQRQDRHHLAAATDKATETEQHV
jgi:hypothetical protein